MLVDPSGGSLWIRMASGSCAPQHRTTQPGGGSSAGGCVGRCEEDVCDLPQGSAPHQHPGCWGRDTRMWVLSRVSARLVPHSLPACCAGPRGRDCDLEAGFLLGGPHCGHSPHDRGAGTLLVWNWLKKHRFGVSEQPGISSSSQYSGESYSCDHQLASACPKHHQNHCHGPCAPLLPCLLARET